MSIRGKRVVVAQPMPSEISRRGMELGLKADMKADIHNRFDIVVRHDDGSEDRAVAHNIVLDALWTRLSTSWKWFSAIAFGSGTGTLSASRTDLFTRIGAIAAGTLLADFSHYSDGYMAIRQQIVIDAGTQTGQTIREVGISYSTGSGSLMTHALLKDMNGNTVSITIGSLDVITIFATVFIRFNQYGYHGGGARFIFPLDMTGLDFSIFGLLAGLSENMTYCLAYLTIFRGKPSAANNLINVSDRVGNKAGTVGYNQSTKKITCKWSNTASKRIGTSELNPSGGGGWMGVNGEYNNGGYGLAGYNNGIWIEFPNTAKQYSVITDEPLGTGDGTRRDFTTAFGAVLNDGSFVLKADGTTVPTSDYSIDYDKPIVSSIDRFFKTVGGNFPMWRTNNSWINPTTGSYEIIENPFHATAGITAITVSTSAIRIDCSNDLTNWVNDVRTNLTSYKNYRYWRAYLTSYQGSISGAVTAVTSSDVGANVHYAAGKAPVNGAAITGSYHTPCIPKDTSHVVDIELEIQLGEYTG